jgi:uncharacterized protein YegP (UPF0339 family)
MAECYRRKRSLIKKVISFKKDSAKEQQTEKSSLASITR